MTVDVVKNVLDKLGSEIVTPSCGRTIIGILQGKNLVQSIDLVQSPVNLKPLSSYIEFRLDSSMQVDLTTCYSYLSINSGQFITADTEAAITVPAIKSVLKKIKHLPDIHRPQLFWFEYDNCQHDASAPGIHLSLNKYVRCDDPWQLNRTDTIATALQYIAILCGRENTDKLQIDSLVDNVQFILETVATFGSVLHVSRLLRNDVETIKLHLVLRVEQVIDLLHQLVWHGSIAGVTQLLTALMDNGCIPQLVFLDLSVTGLGIEPCLGIYVADKLFSTEQKAPFYRAMQGYLLNTAALPDKVNRLFSVIPTPTASANVWCDFKFFIDHDTHVSQKAYLGIKGESEHPLAAIRSALFLSMN